MARSIVLPHGFRRLRVRSLLLVLMLIPTAGLVAVAMGPARSAVSTRDTARAVKTSVDGLSTIVNARLVVADELLQSSVSSLAAGYDISVADLGELYGTDYVAQMGAARAAVDGNATIGDMLAVGDRAPDLVALRAALDSGSATHEQVRSGFDPLIAGLEQVWDDRYASLQTMMRSDHIGGAMPDLADALRASYEAMKWGDRRTTLTIQVVAGADPETVVDLLDAASRQATAREAYEGLLGTTALIEAERIGADPATRRFEQLLRDLEAELFIATPLAVDTNDVVLGANLADGDAWTSSLGNLVQATAADLRTTAAAQEHDATTSLREQVGLALIVTLAAAAGALLLARSLTRPVRRLEAAAHEIQHGRFDLDPIETGGARELADTAVAFNEMADTLAAVEAHAVALADDPDAPLLGHQLPGRTGRALQVALDQLRVSMRAGELQRRELEEAATHDSLTGLLNRNAALTMIERDLASAQRAGSRVMVLFVDLDGLKRINDEHGHAAGDEALRMTAAALLATTRESDVVARIGGDEFLVTGIEDKRAEIDQLAERIRGAVASNEVTGVRGPIPLHCSIGVALSDAGGTDVDALISRADAALYVAKGRGRDRVAWDEPACVASYAARDRNAATAANARGRAVPVGAPSRR